MCFSNLPIEFDERGNPRLADDADDVTQLDPQSKGESPLDEDPDAAYAEIVASVSKNVREMIQAERPAGDGHADERGADERADEPESARGD